MCKSTISMAIFYVANCKRLLGRVVAVLEKSWNPMESRCRLMSSLDRAEVKAPNLDEAREARIAPFPNQNW